MIPIARGVRQSCVISLDLFSLYAKMGMREIEVIPRAYVNSYNVNNIRYADDTILISDTSDGLETILNKVIVESKKIGLALNTKIIAR